MRGAEGVEWAFAAAGKAGEPVFLSEAAHAVPTAGQDLVGIALVAHVPDQPVVRGIEDVMQGDGEFHHAETRAEMTAALEAGIRRLLPPARREVLQGTEANLDLIGARLQELAAPVRQ